MKRIFLVAVSVVLLVASCQKTEVINPLGGRSMSFSTGMSKLTKAPNPDAVDAENDGERNLEFQHFSVWAYKDVEGDFSANVNNIAADGIYDGMRNLLVECKTPYVAAVPEDNDKNIEGSDKVPGVWKTKKEYYWPGEGKNLRFFAVSADGNWLRPTATGATCPVEIDYATPSMTVKNFEVKAQPVKDGETVVKTAANEDLMIADFVKQSQTKTTIDLTFRHTLSKIEFVFKTLPAATGETAPSVWVQSLQVGGMKYKGNLSVTPADAAAAAWNLEWTLDNATTTFTDDWTENATYPSDIDADAASDLTAMELTTGEKTFSTWLMMPQPISADNTVSITYVINKRKFTSVFPLNGDKNTKITKWDVNQHVKYTVVLAPNTISFTPTVQPWKTPETEIEYQN